MTRERNDSGRYVETVGPDDVLGTFDAVDGPVITSTDVSEYLECTTEAARQKLKRLVDDGTLARRRTGRTFVYWRTAETTADESDAHTPRERSASQEDRDTTADEQRREAPENGGNHTPLDDVLADLPSTVDPDAAREAILAARVFLKERGRATRSDFVRGVMRDFPLGYDVDNALAKIESGEGFRGSWWRNVVKPGLEALDDVEKPPRGASEWKYVELGDDTDA